MLASIESFLGSVWFGLALGVVGYVVGNVVPVSRLGSIFKK